MPESSGFDLNGIIVWESRLTRVDKEMLMRAHASRRLATVAIGTFAFIATIAASPPSLAPGNAHLTPASLKAALASGSSRDKIVSLTYAAQGTVTVEFTPPPADGQPVGETNVDLSSMAGGGLAGGQAESAASVQTPDKAQQCAAGTIPPQIFKAKGKLTSGGYLVVEGACFGNSGSVKISGFPNGDLKVTNEAWTPTAITVQLPTVSGVPDLTMHVQVKRILTSKVFDAKFIAAIGDPVDLPVSDMTNNECAGLGVCIAQAPHPAVGIHVDSSKTSGADIWTLKIPDHWHLHAVKLIHITSAHASSSTINGTGSSKTIKISWAEIAKTVMVPVTTTQTSNSGSSWDSIFEDVISGGAAAAGNTGSTTSTTTTLQPFTVYTEMYRLEATVRGPAGMKPS